MIGRYQREAYAVCGYILYIFVYWYKKQLIGRVSHKVWVCLCVWGKGEVLWLCVFRDNPQLVEAATASCGALVMPVGEGILGLVYSYQVLCKVCRCALYRP